MINEEISPDYSKYFMQMYKFSDKNFTAIFCDFIQDIEFILILVVYVCLGDNGQFTSMKEQKILADIDVNMPF